ncbi:MAG: SDR family oxidoreductase [Dehalococcoidia bacterium]|nr:SDR family oxidoreductase [Dehalococcoidia bacterium]
MRFSGKVALITGGDRGIGRSIGMALARRGADIAFNYRRDAEAAAKTARDIEELGRKALSVQADVTDYQQVKAAVSKTLDTFGRIDILVNNAGIASRGRYVADTDVEEMLHLYNVHVMGAFHFTKECLPTIRKQSRGDIIFISSVSPHFCMAGHAPYAAAKAGLEAMASCLAKEELPNNIRVNTIACGLVDTEMGVRINRAVTGKEIKDIAKSLPFGRACQPEDVGNLCAFLCSEEGSYISGDVIFLNGGVPLK